MTTTANAATKVDDSHIQVEQGDTLSEIAHDNGIDLDQLASMNNIANKNLIHVGDKLVITPQAKNNQSQSTNTQVQTSATTQPQTTSQAPAQQNSVSATSTSSLSGGEQAAKDWIAAHESGGNYGAMNGQYIGKFQLSSSYLNGDYSAANQERVADQYVAQRYGSWQAAQAHWMSAGWY